MKAGKSYSKVLFYWKSALWALLIAYGLFSSGDNLPKHHFLDFKHLDKVIHFGLFFILELLILYDSKVWILRNTSKHKIKINGTAIAILYAGFTEIVQLEMCAERKGDFFDFAADLIGIILALFLFDFFYKTINQYFLRS